MSLAGGHDEAGRKRPAKGVFIPPDQPTIVFVTVCTHQRRPWMASRAVQTSLESAWSEAQAWLVGDFLLMPDHVHFFCAPRDLSFTLESWMRYWKSQFRRRHLDTDWEWQVGCWDTRMRTSEQYHEKWIYVQENPVRKGLVKTPGDWPFQGRLNALRWG